MWFYVFKDTAGQWRWRLYAGNNQIIAVPGEGYINKKDCLDGIALVKSSFNAPIKEG